MTSTARDNVVSDSGEKDAARIPAGSPYHCMWRFDGVVYYNDKKPE